MPEDPSVSTPPVAMPPPVPESGWATGLGVVAIVYAIAGVLVNGIGLAVMNLGDQAMTGQSGPLQWTFSGVAILLGVLLLAGGIGLLRRRRWGVRAVTTWVVARLILLLVAGSYGWLMLPAQVDAQVGAIEARMAEERRGGGTNGSRGVRVEGSVSLDREAMLKWSKLAFVGGVVVTGAFPAVTGWVVSNRRRREEVAAWSG